jgi:photosystem II stability/assembly factor-like uncharacterized protein
MSMLVALSSPAQAEHSRLESHGPSGNGFASFTVDPQDDRIVYAATGRGIYKSADAGVSWHASNEGLTSAAVTDVVIDPRRRATVYAATAGGVFKSDDSANTWRATPLRLGTVTVAIAPNDSHNLYAAADLHGIFKSTDGGDTWRRLFSDPLERVYALAVDPRNPNIVYAGAGSGVFKTLNGEDFSVPFAQRGLFLDESSADARHRLDEGFVTSLVINPRDPAVLYVGCDYGVFKSTNSAIRWRRSSRGLIGSTRRFRLVGSLAIDRRHPRTLYAGLYPGGVFKTTDAGAHWRLVGLRKAGYILALAIAPQKPNVIYAASSGGARPGAAYKSSDGGRTWHALSLQVAG